MFTRGYVHSWKSWQVLSETLHVWIFGLPPRAPLQDSAKHEATGTVNTRTPSITQKNKCARQQGIPECNDREILCIYIIHRYNYIKRISNFSLTMDFSCVVTMNYCNMNCSYFKTWLLNIEVSFIKVMETLYMIWNLSIHHGIVILLCVKQCHKPSSSHHHSYRC